MLKSQSKAVNKVDELKHQITANDLYRGQNRSCSEDVQELKQVICSQLFKGMACRKY